MLRNNQLSKCLHPSYWKSDLFSLFFLFLFMQPSSESSLLTHKTSLFSIIHIFPDYFWPTSDLCSLNSFILEPLFISFLFVKSCSSASPSLQIDDSYVSQQTTLKDITEEDRMPRQRLPALSLETIALPLLVFL